jgi:hypothetical protein
MTTEGGKMKRLLGIAAAVGMFVSGPGTALAGEVKGPPGTLDNTNRTAAPAHANSACAFSGLNDYDSNDPDGQTASQVQTAADAWKFYHFPKGVQGKGAPELGIDAGLCRGGTN